MHPPDCPGSYKASGEGDLPPYTAFYMSALTDLYQWADYPGVIPYDKTRELLQSSGLKPDLPPEERTVRGTVVTGLSAKDVQLLDYFEGDVSTLFLFTLL